MYWGSTSLSLYRWFVGVYAQCVKSHTAEYVLGQYEFVTVLLVCWGVRAVGQILYSWVVLGQYKFCHRTASLLMHLLMQYANLCWGSVHSCYQTLSSVD